MNLLVNTAGDLVFTGDDLQMVDGGEELAQLARIYLRSNKNEWFIDPDLGMDHQPFREKKVNEEAIRAAIADALNQTGEFRSLDEVIIDFDRTLRTLRVFFRATANDGQIVQNGVNLDVG